MSKSEPSPQTTLVILLGASQWPNMPSFEASEAFRNSAQDLKTYLLASNQFGLPEANLLDLFDSEAPSDDLDQQIGEFIDQRQQALDREVRDLWVYFIGHGGMSSDSEYILAIRRIRENNLKLSGFPIQSLASTLKQKARSLRCFIVLDCCFAGQALPAFQSDDVAPIMVQAVGAFAEATQPTSQKKRIPSKGTTLLCSSSRLKTSYISDDHQYTRFTQAFLSQLRLPRSGQGNRVSWRSIFEDVAIALTQAEQPAPKPELHNPDQREGEVSDVLFFPNLLPAAIVKTQFQPNDEVIQCYVILSEAEKSKSGKSLGLTVRQALNASRTQIQEITGLEVDRNPYVVEISEVFSSPEQYKNALLALCRARIVIFDLTNCEPAMMVLMGIRSVVRRGVSIASAGGEYVVGEPYDYPFNIKEVNIVSHSEKQIVDGGVENNPAALIRNKLVEGFRQLAELPHYLDLPAFEAIRRLPSNPRNRKLRSYSEQVLVLCSFSQQHRQTNWKLYLQINLALAIQARTDKTPSIIRTLDVKSPRLVSQTLYEAIRLTSLCIVDLTEWRPNVFFELGVRLASHRISPICIIEHQHRNLIEALAQRNSAELSQLQTHLQMTEEVQNRLTHCVTQCMQLLEQFNPIEYGASSEHEDLNEDAFERMLDRYQEQIDQDAQFAIVNPTYSYISQNIDCNTEISAQSVYRELLDAANLLSTVEIETEGKSPVLYPENSTLLQKAEEGAKERRLAAWYYMHNRFTPEEIVQNPTLLNDYLLVGEILARSLKETDSTLAREIYQQVKQIKVLAKENGV